MDMFENIVSNIKLQTSKASGNVLTTLKNRSSKVSNLLPSRNQGSVLAQNYTMGGTDQMRYNCDSNERRKRVLKWNLIVDNRARCITIQQNEPRRTLHSGAENGIDENSLEVVIPEEITSRRNDREEIRRRLAMGPEADDYYGLPGERQGGRKPSLQSRLQSGMNLQICFMNETASDGESPVGSECGSPSSSPPTTPSTILSSSLPSSFPSSFPSSRNLIDDEELLFPAVHHQDNMKPIPLRSLSLKSSVLCHGASQPPSQLVGGVVGRWDILGSAGGLDPIKWDGEDFFGRQARLQAEARVALAQAKEMAHMQMEVERQRQKVNSPITQMVRASLMKVGLKFPADRRRVSRQMLTEMNVAQLQVIVNDLHTQIEVLNEDLVKLLMERDDLHMEQDSMLVDIEDLTRYLGAKEKALKESGRVGASGIEDGPKGSGSLPSLPLIFRNSQRITSRSGRSRTGLPPKK